MSHSPTISFSCPVLLGLAVLAGCQQAPDNEAPVLEASNTLTGTVIYRERMALPPGATVEIGLEDVTIADAPAIVIAAQTIATEGRQVPIPFELRFAAERIEPSRRYGVRAAIRAPNGELMFATRTHHPVQGAAAETVEILVERVAADRGAAAPIDGPWRLVAIQRPGAADERVGAEFPYTIEFGADGRYAGQAHCNRYAGGYERPESGRLRIFGGAATLAACPAPSIADEFVRAIGAVTGYELRGEELVLSFNAGGTLTFARDSAPAPAAALEVGRTFAFDCDGDVSFTVRTGPGEVALWAPRSVGGQNIVLSVTETASGVRYEEGDNVFWSNGELATFEIGGQTFADCQSNPSKVPWADAARRGVTFRALGNEPSWFLEIHPERLAMVTDLGASRTELAYAAPVVEGLKTTYRTARDEIVAVVERVACTDNMSGDAFEATATVTFNRQTFRGCGRFL